MKSDIKVLTDEDIKNLTKDLFEGRVEKIINKYRIIISPGSEVFDRNDLIEIVSPVIEFKNKETDSSEVYSFVKAELLITDVFTDYAIAFSNETKTVKGIGSIAAMGAGAMADREVIKELKVDERFNLDLSLKNSEILIGDYVKLVK